MGETQMTAKKKRYLQALMKEVNANIIALVHEVPNP